MRRVFVPQPPAAALPPLGRPKATVWFARGAPFADGTYGDIDSRHAAKERDADDCDRAVLDIDRVRARIRVYVVSAQALVDAAERGTIRGLSRYVALHRRLAWHVGRLNGAHRRATRAAKIVAADVDYIDLRTPEVLAAARAAARDAILAGDILSDATARLQRGIEQARKAARRNGKQKAARAAPESE